jgi:Zn-dependent M28 family amino/carboxypeptidase
MSFRTRRACAVIAAGALAASLAFASPAYAAPNNNTVKKLTKAVTLEGVMNHLEAFQAIADVDGDRAAGREGYDASVEYVVAQLEAAGYDPDVQEFEFPYFEENSELVRDDPATTWVDGRDFLRADFPTGVPEGTAEGQVVAVDFATSPVPDVPPGAGGTSGCTTDDFAGFPAGEIALVQRGGCGFAVKALCAQEAGASAVIVANDGRLGLVSMVGDATGLTIPAIFVTTDVGLDLASTPDATVTVTVDFTTETRTSYNVFAETRSGNDANTVMAGAHLDSVQDGAGINDNGTGSAALLETAIQMAGTKNLNNTVRFAWWGAEEEGLLGSEYYVEQLSDEEADDIALYLNFDMIGSPNYVFGVYDGDNSGQTAPAGFIPEGSAAIEDVFESYYTSVGQPYQDTDFSGRSDYGPFIAIGIPAGGLFTGAEGVKTEAEAIAYGGVVGAAYDPCYHAPCDNLTGEGQDEALYAQLEEDYTLVGNVNTFALDINSDAVATAIVTFAFDTSTVNDVRVPGKSHGAGKSAEAHSHKELATQ